MTDHSDTERLYSLGNQAELTKLVATTLTQGVLSTPRGMKIRERFDTQLTIHPWYPFQGWAARNYDVDYFRKEMLWKLGASRMDDSIKAHAKMWESVQNPDGSFNSNYGQFWFGKQMGVFKVVQELVRDMHSRRACIPMLRDEHLDPEVTDTVCTESVTFHIRNYCLRMSVHMRSSDQIFGLGTDLPTFSVLMHLVHGMLQDTYPGLAMGTITLTAASSHIYERHFNMVSRIMVEPGQAYKHVRLPQCSGNGEAQAIIAHRGKAQADIPSFWHLYRFIYGNPA